jgi:uncharacterized membrane protein
MSLKRILQAASAFVYALFLALAMIGILPMVPFFIAYDSWKQRSWPWEIL